jgi:glycosyltransferase involved in cell wall biosynthesis
VANNSSTLKIQGGIRCHSIIKERTDVKPLVSIITAVYNGNAAIEKTIKSVVNQNYPNFEYLVIDGGSTDGTVETLKKYNNVIDYWVSEPDKGVYDALNKGIDLAKGEWLYFLGADDRLADEDVLSFIFSKPPKSKMLYGNVVWGKTGRIYDGKFSKMKLCYKNICHQAIFYHRDLFRILGKFELNYPFWADYLFNMQAFAAKEVKPIFVNKIVAVYSIEGISSRTADHVFEKDRAILIKRLFGIWHFIYFKCLYNKFRRTEQLIKDIMQKYTLFLL